MSWNEDEPVTLACCDMNKQLPKMMLSSIMWRTYQGYLLTVCPFQFDSKDSLVCSIMLVSVTLVEQRISMHFEDLPVSGLLLWYHSCNSLFLSCWRKIGCARIQHDVSFEHNTFWYMEWNSNASITPKVYFHYLQLVWHVCYLSTWDLPLLFFVLARTFCDSPDGARLCITTD